MWPVVLFGRVLLLVLLCLLCGFCVRLGLRGLLSLWWPVSGGVPVGLAGVGRRLWSGAGPARLPLGFCFCCGLLVGRCWPVVCPGRLCGPRGSLASRCGGWRRGSGCGWACSPRGGWLGGRSGSGLPLLCCRPRGGGCRWGRCRLRCSRLSRRRPLLPWLRPARRWILALRAGWRWGVGRGLPLPVLPRRWWLRLAALPPSSAGLASPLSVAEAGGCVLCPASAGFFFRA